MTKSKQQGFTLIELVIVITIIVILLAFAIPNYFNYVKQTRVTEAAILFEGFKIEVWRWYAVKGYYPHFDQLIRNGIVYKGAFVEATYDDGLADQGTPMVCFQVKGFEPGRDSIGWRYIPDPSDPSQKLWSCKWFDACTTIENQYFPYTCQEEF
jgi:type IV pilus assembly protein PilA